MVIEFLCPNGHRIHCPADRAGQKAKCPKCGVKFIVPDAGDGAAPEPAGASSVATQPAGGSGTSALKSGPGSGVSATDQIEFLCTNGHRLHGPRRLQGHPGQCPECGCKFRIPTYDDAVEEQEERPGPTKGPDTVESPADAPLSLLDSQGTEDNHKAVSSDGSERLRTAIQAGGSSRLERPKDAPTLPGLLQQFWAARSEGSVVELHFANGQTLVPERFVQAASQGNHGVFSVKEPDGTYTLTAIAWEAISHVVVRGLAELPEALRD